MCPDVCDRHSFTERQILTHLILFCEKKNSSIIPVSKQFKYIFNKNDAKYSFIAVKEYLWLGVFSIYSPLAVGLSAYFTS